MSVSFLLAAYTWIVPLATIYPPGALTISATPFLSTESVHISVPQLVFDPNFNPFLPGNVSRIAKFAGVNHERYAWNNDQTTSGTVNLSTNLQVMRPQPLLLRLSESVIAAGEIMLKPPATLEENSTYMLEFMGPQLSCRNVELFNHTISNTGDFTELVLGEAAHSPYSTKTAMQMSAMDKAYSVSGIYEWQIFRQNVLGGTPCQDPQGNSRTLDENGAREYNDGKIYGALANGTYSSRYLMETSKTSCTERYVRYIANVTYIRGVRSIQYTMRDIEPQPVKDLSIMMVWEAASDVVISEYGQPRNASIDAIFAASTYFQRSREYLEERFRYWNAFTIYAAFLGVIESATYRNCYIPRTDTKCNAEWTRSNGSRAAFGSVNCMKEDRGECH
jgi:hypothetical protein